jgi:K+ transporter
VITINNILSIEDRTALKNIIDEEIKNNRCEEVPFHQSFNNMHEKYKNEESIKNLSIRALKEAELATNQKLSILKLWFVIIKYDLDCGFHNHKNVYTTCVYFLENCENNGTIFQINNSNLQLMCKDDTIIIFNPEIMHNVPKWSGKDRYSVAIDFELKN